MEVKLKDVLHLYLGCKVLFEKSNYYFVHELQIHKGETKILTHSLLHHFEYHDSNEPLIKPLLRILSSMTEEEWLEIEYKICLDPHAQCVNALKDNFIIDQCDMRFGWRIINETLIELRNRGIDCDNLIQSGQAINKSSIK